MQLTNVSVMEASGWSKLALTISNGLLLHILAWSTAAYNKGLDRINFRTYGLQ